MISLCDQGFVERGAFCIKNNPQRYQVTANKSCQLTGVMLLISTNMWILKYNFWVTFSGLLFKLWKSHFMVSVSAALTHSHITDTGSSSLRERGSKCWTVRRTARSDTGRRSGHKEVPPSSLPPTAGWKSALRLRSEFQSNNYSSVLRS